MKYKLIFLAILHLNYICLFSLDKSPVNVLFIGNSYTFAYSMPKTIQQIINDDNEQANIESIAISSFYLKNHYNNINTIEKIKEKKWDYIIIQEQSQLPSLDDNTIIKESYPYLKGLDSIIKENNSCTQVYLFMTWGRKNGDTANCKNYPYLCTYEGMDKALRQRYQEYANAINANVVPIGLVWNYIRNFYPELELYEPDNSHPSLLGSIVNSFTFYSFIWNKNPYNLKDYYKIDSATNYKIKSAIDYVKNNYYTSFQQPKFLIGINSEYNLNLKLINDQDKAQYLSLPQPNIQLNDSNNRIVIKPICNMLDSSFYKNIKYYDRFILIDNFAKIKIDKKLEYLEIILLNESNTYHYKARIYDKYNYLIKNIDINDNILNLDMKYLPNEFYIDLELNNNVKEKLKITQ